MSTWAKVERAVFVAAVVAGLCLLAVFVYVVIIEGSGIAGG